MKGEVWELMIEFFSNDDSQDILNMLQNSSKGEAISSQEEKIEEEKKEVGIDDRTPEEIKKADDTPIEEDLYSIKNFSI